MRTTLTLDDQLATRLKRLSADTGRAFKDVINDTLRAGLQGPRQSPARPYRLRPSALGAPLVAGRLDKALQLADELEDTALVSKLEHRK